MESVEATQQKYSLAAKDRDPTHSLSSKAKTLVRSTHLLYKHEKLPPVRANKTARRTKDESSRQG